MNSDNRTRVPKDLLKQVSLLQKKLANREEKLYMLKRHFSFYISTSKDIMQFLAEQTPTTAPIIQKMFVELLANYKTSLLADNRFSKSDIALVTGLHTMALRGLQISLLVGGADNAELLAVYEANKLPDNKH